MSEGSPKAPDKPRKFQAIRGTRDILPPETALWNRVEQTAHAVFATFGFGEIRLPIFEETELFARSIGADTDVVSKEMYTFVAHSYKYLKDLYSEIEDAYDDSIRLGDENLFLTPARKFIDGLEASLRGGEIGLTVGTEAALQSLTSTFRHYEQALEDPNLKGEPELEILRHELFFGCWDFPFGETITLRPEATASVCRAYIEQGMQTLPQPVKLYYMGPMFRRERPQKGRYRQFYQIGAEVLGGPDAPAIDAEVIEMLTVFFAKLGLEGAELYINSIGCRECRPKYVEALRAALIKVKEKLGPDSQRRIETNPLRVLDSKLESEQAIIETLPRISSHLCAECAKNYEEVKRELGLRGIKYEENWRLVRGLDYYMCTTFEITAPGLGSQNAVCGGGRYDGLVELLGGPPTKGIGFAIGEDRLILSLQESGKGTSARGLDVYIAWMGEKAYEAALRAARTLREAGLSVELPPTEQKFGKALGHADKLAARYALILGEDEVSSGQWTLKTLADSKQVKLTEPELLARLKKGV
ncbi:MAG TPA: histidine--tRNA ligase [Candidatus Acidoferrales bacterium]|nr:histidine--tRNA ligase [Candidatus Acidoferrales bacterium]